jgi:hypothetical protein
MLGSKTDVTRSHRWRNRALSTAMAAIVMIVVIVVVGAAAYYAVGNSPSKSTAQQSNTTCQPVSSGYCHNVTAITQVHDLTLFTPFKAAQTLDPVPFTAQVPTSDGAVSSYTFNFGDGSSTTSAVPTVSHVYTEPGTYLVLLEASIGTKVHDNYNSLVAITVSAGYSAASGGANPTVSGSILSNSTSTTGATGVLLAGNEVSLSGAYTGAPTNPLFTLAPPSIGVSYPAGASVTESAQVTSASGASATFNFSTAGTYVVTYVGVANGTGSFSGQHSYQNYSWSVIVTPSSLHGKVAGSGAATSPHPGLFINYFSAPGGASSLDPSIAYDTVSYEPIINTYEALIMFNGSTTGPAPNDYLPVLSTCVPGANSVSCQNMYGSTLYNASTQAYTFPIDTKAQFYDPTTGAHWGVYPSDVMFSVLRTEGFSTQPGVGSHNGWILAQSLLPAEGASVPMAANPHWDGGIHASLNNTPAAMFATMLVNSSLYCTAKEMANSHGCITFLATGNDQNWPYFLELITDQLGASVQSCGWASATDVSGGDAGIPDWTAGTISGSGDQPCLLPGGATTTDSPAYQTAISHIAPTAWDAWETSGASSSPPGNMIHSIVASGPYYLANYQIGSAYTLEASPAYQPNEYCTWQNCMPAVGHMTQKVEVTWETNIAEGEQAIAAGVADTATIPGTDTALFLQLVQEGKVQAIAFPSISIYFFPYTLDFNLAGAQKYTTNPITVPTDWFSYVGMRQFFSLTYPYTTIENTILTKDGIQGGFNYGGAIPQFMANYYPTNVTWPSVDPSIACSGSGANGPGCASWWWTQMTTVGSPYYDPEAAACTSSNPCQLPLIGETGAPVLDEQENLWVNSISQFSNGAVKAAATDINFANLVANSLFSGPYQNSMPVYTLGWSPDYPDPTDYVTPLYYPDSTYTYSDVVLEQLSLPSFDAGFCSSSPGFWSSQNEVNNTCQGAAYKAMVTLLEGAAIMPAGPARVLAYNMAEHIANLLSLYVYQYQLNQVYGFSSWVNVASMDTNVTTGGGNDITYFLLNGNGVW